MKDIRESFHFNQRQWAGYLGITRSQLACIECEDRHMNAEAINKSAILASLVKEDLPEPPQLQPDAAAQAALHQQLDKRLSDLQWKLSRAQQKLTDMQAAHERHRSRLKALNALVAHTPTGPDGDKDRQWAQMVEAETMQSNENCGLLAQRLQRVEIELLETEVAKIGELLAE